jgi:chromosomal replication initiation ATPase DnaA
MPEYRPVSDELHALLYAICAERRVNYADVISPRKMANLVETRRQFAYEARQRHYSLPDIGAALHRHHTTVLNLLAVAG